MHRMSTVSDLPIRTAPEISQKVANQQACRSVSTFEPTLVPNEFATSLAPMPNARIKAITKPTTTSTNTVPLNGSILHSGSLRVLTTDKAFDLWVLARLLVGQRS